MSLTPDIPAQCPYAQVAQMGHGKLAQHMHSVAYGINALRQIVSEDYARHPSFFKEAEYHYHGQGPIPPHELEPLERFIGNVHNIFRSRIALDIANILDESGLRPETQDVIRRFRRLCLDYRNLVVATADKHSEDPIRRKADYSRVPYAEIKAIEGQLKELVEELKESELATCESIHVRAADGSLKHVSNKGEVGLFLFCLKEATKAQFDKNKLPQSIGRDFLSVTIGLTDAIVARWNGAGLAEEVHTIHQKAYADIICEIASVKRELQLCYLTDAKNDPKALAACEHLLTLAGLPLLPEKLENFAEFQAVYNCVKDNTGKSDIKLTPPLKVRDLASIEATIHKKRNGWMMISPKTQQCCDLLVHYIEENKATLVRSRRSASLG